MIASLFRGADTPSPHPFFDIPPPPWSVEDYRCGVGIVLFHHLYPHTPHQGTPHKVFAGQRLDNPEYHWQMPQGGIDDHENITDALYRELFEETGISEDKVVPVAVAKRWVRYDLPPHLRQRLWKGKFAGQQQLWFALRFCGDDSDINLNATDHPEFRNYAWQTMDEILRHVVPFKRSIYQDIAQIFAPYGLS